MGSKRKDPVEVPLVAQKGKDAVEVPPATQKRKKVKASKTTIETALKEDDYDQIVARLKEEMKDSLQAMQTSQDKLQSTVDKQLLEMKSFTKNTVIV